jgi:hypothetical protein
VGATPKPDKGQLTTVSWIGIVNLLSRVFRAIGDGAAPKATNFIDLANGLAYSIA